MSVLKGTVFHRSSTALGVAGASTSNRMELGSTVTGKSEGVYGTLRGMVASDQSGSLEIYFGFQASDLAVLPAQGANDNNLIRVAFTLTAGGNGLNFTQAVVAPFAVARFTNTSGVAQTAFRFHVEATE